MKKLVVFAGMLIWGIAPLSADGQPVLDLILLGMGEEGMSPRSFPTSLRR